ncbi:putative membrane protein [Pilibacter termitis]|uniref:Putative membrane protein n=1 Tax=Pilibacter termitis TaxID=263852 RepID=A0A1T4R9D2_9ENTE|nr:YhgE/Pip domain-containing protein [Pilibacter termitis]SKA12426.1 putative membrane protein [Pilibacter termitis]
MFQKEWRKFKENRMFRLTFVAVAFIPLMYAAVFLKSLWNPYGELQNLPVGVVNLDKAVMKNGEKMSVGADFVKELKSSQTLDFHFVDEKTAKKQLADGKYYMVVTIPEDFSKNAASLDDKEPKRMRLDYATSAGYNFIAMKMSESAVMKMQSQLNEKITKVYSKSIFASLEKAGVDIQEAGAGAEKITENLGLAKNGAESLHGGLAQVESGAGELSNGANKAYDGANKLATGALTAKNGVQQYTEGVLALSNGAGELNQAGKQVANGANELSTGVTQAKNGATSLSQGAEQLNDKSQELTTGASSLSSGAGVLLQGATQVAEGSEQLSNGVESLSTGLMQAQTGATSLSQGATQLSEGVHQAVEQQKALAVELTNIAAMATQAGDEKTSQALTALLQQMQANAPQAQALVDGADQVSAGASTLSDSLSTACAGASAIAENAKKLSTGAGDVKTGAEQLSNGLSSYQTGVQQYTDGVASLTQGAGELTQGLTQVQSGAESLSVGGVKLSEGTQQLSEKSQMLTANSGKLVDGVSQVSDGVNTLATGLHTLAPASEQLSAGIGQLTAGASDLNGGLGELKAGSTTLATKLSEGSSVMQEKGKPSEDMLQQLAQPVITQHTEKTPVANNGTSMVPYMTAIGLWIGSLSMVIAFNVLNREKRSKTAVEWWGAKFSQLYLLGIMQSVVLYGGLLLLGTKILHPVETLLLMIAGSLAFISINSYLANAFGKVGNFLSIVLLVMQLGSAGGTYPLVLSPKIFRLLHPFLPISHEVFGLRESISIGIAPFKEIFILILFALVFALLNYGRIYRIHYGKIAEPKELSL